MAIVTIVCIAIVIVCGIVLLILSLLLPLPFAIAICHNLITTVIMITIAPGLGRPRQGYSAQSSSTFSMPFLTFSLYQCSTFTFSLSTFSPLVFLDATIVSLGITLCTFSPASLHNWLPTGSSVISSFTACSYSLAGLSAPKRDYALFSDATVVNSTAILVQLI